MANITFLPVQGTINLSGEKVIALNQTNIDLLKKGYNNDPKIANIANAVSNKDVLAQSFGTIEPTSVEIPVTPTIESATVETTPAVEETPIQLTNIPPVQNIQNLESNPVNLNMTQPEIPTIEPINIENNIPNPIDLSIDGSLDPLKDLQGIIPNTNLNLSPLEEVSTDNKPEQINIEETPTVIPQPLAPETNNIQENNAVSPFQVTSAPNIFDQPISPINLEIGEKETKPIENNTPEVSNIEFSNINIPDFTANTNQIKTNEVIETTSITNDNISLELAIEKENAELFERLANNCRKKIELLESQLKKTNPLENNIPSASELFTPNGILDDNKVLDNQV